MAKRFIGIDLDGQTARVALLNNEGSMLRLELHQQDYSSAEEAQQVLGEIIGPTRALGDHLVTALPARAGFYRSLHFPFRERSKLNAVLSAEMDAQTPISLRDYCCVMLTPQAEGEGYSVPAAAVPREAVDLLLDHFPDPEQNPRRIDFRPQSLLSLCTEDAVVVDCGEAETLIVWGQSGRVRHFRLLPSLAMLGADPATVIKTEILQLLGSAAASDPISLLFCGNRVTDDLQAEFDEPPFQIKSFELKGISEPVATEYLPAVALALGEKNGTGSERFNFRSGAYAPQGQLESLKRKLFIVAALVLLCLLAVGGRGYLELQNRSDQADQLKAQMATLFRLAVPGVTTVFDAPLQMQSHLKGLQQEARLLGIGGQVKALETLNALSTLIGGDINTDIREMVYSGKQMKLDGYTDSFESVNRMAQVLKTSPLFAGVEIGEARMSADGSRVDYQLEIELAQTGGVAQ
ncbi:MAG: hypothetical protein C0618_10205 [Desulfuromonas sp.]|nr:MAG: hypothetical protein C0618_10205 [Desulfuromonas sp.]